MPIYSERRDIPDVLMKALTSEEYKESLDLHFEGLPEKYQKCNFSVTTLVRSPRQRVLFNRHHMKVLLDPMSQYWKLWGHVVHSLLEKYADNDRFLVERRFGVPFTYQSAPGLLKGIRREGKPVDTVYLHGQVDLYDRESKTITDWKVTKAVSMLYGSRPEYVAQLNMLAYLFRKAGYEVKGIRNVYLFREWNERDVKEGTDYPKEQISIREVEMWPEAKVEAYIRERLRLHMEADMIKDDALPHCTKEELWMRDSLFKVYKIDFNKKTNESRQQKTAKFSCGSRSEAEAWIKDPINFGADFNIVEFPAKPMRCTFCEISGWCSQFHAMKAPPSEEES